MCYLCVRLVAGRFETGRYVTGRFVGVHQLIET